MANAPTGTTTSSGFEVVDTLPAYSMGRVIANLTPGELLFSSVKHHTHAAEDIRFFSYGTESDHMKEAGFGKRAKPTHKHTNLAQAFRPPFAGSMHITRIGVSIVGTLSKPAALVIGETSDDDESDIDDDESDDLVSDQAGWTFLPDFATGELRDFLFREFASAYVPYFAFGDRGDRFYIPDVSILATPANIFDGKHAAIVGAPFEMTEGLDWTETGAQSKLVFGFELARDRRCPPASDRRTWKRIAELYGMDDAAEGGAGIAGEPSGEKKSARARRVDGAKQYQGLAAFTLMVTFWGAKSATIPNR